MIHLAAQTQVIDADLNPRKTFDSNIKGTWNILENCRTHDIPVVVASSDKAYEFLQTFHTLKTTH